MKARTNVVGMVVLVGVLLPILAMTAFAGEKGGGKEEMSAAEVKREAAEMYDALKAYTVQQRDQAVEAARKAVDKLDSRIDAMQTDLENKWQEMSETARESSHETLRELRMRRNEVAEWYGGLKHSSAEAWDDIKHGFAKSYEDLSRSVKSANENFSDSK